MEGGREPGPDALILPRPGIPERQHVAFGDDDETTVPAELGMASVEAIDDLACGRVDSGCFAAIVRDRHEGAVRRDGYRAEASRQRSQHSDRSRVADERSEKIALSHRRGRKLDALAREQQRAVEVGLDERLGAEPLGLGGDLGRSRPQCRRARPGCVFSCLAALRHGEDPARDRGREQHRHADQEAAQPSVGALGAPWSPSRRPRGSR